MRLEDIVKFHVLFERINPFADGNGSVSRLLMAFEAIQNNIIPPLITNENREEYLRAINNKDELYTFYKSV